MSEFKDFYANPSPARAVRLALADYVKIGLVGNEFLDQLRFAAVRLETEEAALAGIEARS